MMKKVFLIVSIGICLISTVFSQVLLPPNKLKNGYFKNYDENNFPIGCSTFGDITLEVVHPYTTGFQGPYTENAPSTAVSDPDYASKNRPYWYGRYNTGPRTIRGGLNGAWGSDPGGKILRITGTNSGSHTMVRFPFEGNQCSRRYFISGWVKILRGNRIGIGTDSGYKNIIRGHSITKDITDTGQQGWYRLSTVVDTSKVTDLNGNALTLGIEGDESGVFEIYIALPYVAIVDDDSWAPSMSDVIADVLSTSGQQLKVADSLSIGTDTVPEGYVMAVNGNLIAKEITVATDWADYVFNPEYDLYSLEEVEQHIAEHGHLPDVPNEKQVELNGISLGEMNRILLQKIEELTLYTLQQQKEIDGLKNLLEREEE